MSAIVARFAALRREHSGRPLIHLPGSNDAWSAADIWDSHLASVAHFTEADIRPGSAIVSAAGNNPASVALLLACRSLGIALLPVEASATRREILALAERFGAAALVLPSAMAEPHGHESDDCVPLASGLCVLPCADEGRRTYYKDTALLKLTSGSTGAPKAALQSEAQLIADGTQIAAAMGIQPGDTQMAAIPLSHAYGLGVLLMPLLLQGTALVLRETFVPHQLPADARKFGARIFPGVPFMFQYFVANPPAGGWPSCLDRVISAGAPLAPATVRAFHDRFGVKIHSFYGTTETGGIAFDAADEIDEGPTTVGRALPGVTITLEPDADRPAGPGRIHVRSAAVAREYADHPGGSFDAGGFLTGDCGTMDAEGRLTLTGRVSAFVSVAGRKVAPHEIEETLRSMPGVEDVRVVAAPDLQRGQQIVACLVMDAAHAVITALDVRRFCVSRLAPYKIPRTIIFVNAIPLTERGKTDRAALDSIVRTHLGVPPSAL